MVGCKCVTRFSPGRKLLRGFVFATLITQNYFAIWSGYKALCSEKYMQIIYEIIQNNPELNFWVFSLVNITWGLFAYFNKQRHQRELKYLEQNLKYSADRRLKIFDLKATQYSQYVTDLDSFGKKNQIEMPARMQPIFDEYLLRYLQATDAEDKEKEREAIGWLSSQVSTLIQEGYQDIMKLKYESNRLKLIATEEMLETFDSIESLTQLSLDATNEFIQNFTEIAMDPQTERSKEFQDKATVLANKIQEKSKLLLSQMRREIIEI